MKWEYMIAKTANLEELNRLGGEGWELVSTTRIAQIAVLEEDGSYDEDFVDAVLKRPLECTT